MVAVMAPLPDDPVVRPRPMLRLVDDVPWLDDDEHGNWEADDRVDSDVVPLAELSGGTDVAFWRPRRTAAQVRRRRIVTGSMVAAALVLLALPLRPLAGRPLTTASTNQSLAAGAEYVVQPGDTLWAIASRLQPSADPRRLVAQMEAETGSDHLVPGEHLRLP